MSSIPDLQYLVFACRKHYIWHLGHLNLILYIQSSYFLCVIRWQVATPPHRSKKSPSHFKTLLTHRVSLSQSTLTLQKNGLVGIAGEIGSQTWSWVVRVMWIVWLQSWQRSSISIPPSSCARSLNLLYQSLVWSVLPCLVVNRNIYVLMMHS